MKAKSVFFCTECGNETGKWFGRCPACGAWNTIVEALSAPSGSAAAKSAAVKIAGTRRSVPKPVAQLDDEEEIRFSTGMAEMDRVLGGGAVRGSLVLVGGAPGIGKSTLLLQICGNIPDAKILYVTGEESQRQLKMRSQRLGVSSDNLFVLAETDINAVTQSVEDLKPDILIIDSVQTMYNNDIASAPGSIGQVKDCTMAVMQLAKTMNITAFVIGHVNKEGAIAGPKVLEHMVDCVLYFEGDRSLNYRILRAAKNRFGSTNEIGVFEMCDTGLREVPNPSEVMLSGRPVNAPGTCVSCVMQGSRPILAEVQALLSPSNANQSRRTANGVDFNRLMLLLAVLEKRGGVHVAGCDAYVNVVGGLELDEPAADLAIALAIASSLRDKPIGEDLAAIGEIGLTGEIRSVPSINQRLQELARLGFKRCVIPAHCKDDIKLPKDMKLLPAKNVRDAVTAIFI